MKNDLWKWRNDGKRGNPKAGFPLFPPFLGNLAKNARFPHSHSSDCCWFSREQDTEGRIGEVVGDFT